MKVMKSPQSVELDITSLCNLRCEYCFHFTSAGDVKSDLPAADWLSFFAELNRHAVMNVTIGGGEPFFRKDLKLIIEGIVRNKMRFSILSNGTLITDDQASFLASTRRCSGVQVSIDGSTPETHDSFRGKGSFTNAIRGIKYLQKYKIPVSVRVTFHRRNVMNIEKICEYLFEDMGLPRFSTSSANYTGLCRQNPEKLILTPKERSFAIEALLKMNKKYNGRISGDAGPLAEGRAWIMMEKARRNNLACLPERGYLTGCGGMMSKIAVRADGVITPCTQLGHIELGQINQDSLEDIWQNHPELIRLRERRNIPLSDFEFCQGCDYINYCTGSCPALAYTTIGTVNHPSPDACIRQFMEQGGKLPEIEY